MVEVIEKTASLDERAVIAKQSEDETERLIEDFRPFLNARVAKYSLWSDMNQREEMFSIAMMAFYESIQKYDISKGHYFPFANRVVCERLIDYIRSIYRHEGKTVPLDEDDEERPSAQSGAIEEVSIRSYDAQRRQQSLVDEIEQFKAELTTWGITMDILTQHSPKHQKVRDTYKRVIAKICQSPDIVQTIQIKRYFPIKAVSELTGLPQKNLERARTFILASIIIKMGDYEYLSDYVCG
jgi:RNA polymerase sigma factor